MAAKQDNEMIKPLEHVEGSDACPLHPKEELKLYCDRCHVPMCVECFCDKHAGHPHNLIRKRATEMLQNIHRLRSQLQDRRKEVATVITRQKRVRSEIDQEYQEALKALKKKYQEDVKRCGDELTEAEDEMSGLEALDKRAANVKPTSKLSAIEDTKTKMTDILSIPLTGRLVVAAKNLRDACKKHVPETPRSDFDICSIGDVVIPITFHSDLRSFAQGNTDTPPAPPQWPPAHLPLRCYNDKKTDVAMMPPQSAAEVLRLTGGHQDLTLGTVNGGEALMAASGEARYVGSAVCEGRRHDTYLGNWFLPCSSSLEDAVTAATGRRPRRITDVTGNIQYDKKMLCGKWREAYQYYLHVKF